MDGLGERGVITLPLSLARIAPSIIGHISEVLEGLGLEVVIGPGSRGLH